MPVQSNNKDHKSARFPMDGREEWGGGVGYFVANPTPQNTELRYKHDRFSEKRQFLTIHTSTLSIPYFIIYQMLFMWSYSTHEE